MNFLDLSGYGYGTGHGAYGAAYAGAKLGSGCGGGHYGFAAMQQEREIGEGRSRFPWELS
jgi:hypothetical protein